MRLRATLLVTAACAGLAMLLVGVSSGYACSGQAILSPLSPEAGPVNSVVTVAGAAWEAGTDAEGNVEIHWASATGPVLGRVNGPTFSTTVTVPDVAPGYYLIVAIAHNTAGDV